MEQNQGSDSIQNAKKALNFVVLVLLAMTMSIEVFLHRRFGSRYFGLQSLIALLGIPTWILLWPEERVEPLLVFWGLFIAMTLRARAECAVMAARGTVAHSRHSGTSRLTRVFRRTPEWKLKGALEPILVFFTGILLLPVSQPLGSYLMCAALAMFVSYGVSDSVGRARATDMNDALIEQELHAARCRDLRDRSRW
jgi:hypothetical protein